MRKLLLFILIPSLLILAGCVSDYQVISDNPVDGYDLYYYDTGELCEAYFEDVYFSDLDHVYFLGYSGCSKSDRHFIKKDDEFITIYDALENGDITLESLMEELVVRDRTPEFGVESGFHRLDFYVNGIEIYQYSAALSSSYNQELISVGTDHVYVYTGTGFNSDFGLYAYIDNEYVRVKELLDDNEFDFELLKPILTEIDKDDFYSDLENE